MQPARVRILDAAYELLSTVGFARATTKEIARAARCSEAALYKYFRNKEELFTNVLSERLPLQLLASIPNEPAEQGLRQSLAEIALRAVHFYRQSFPLAMSLHAEPTLRRRYGDLLDENEAGPHKPIEYLDAYLRTERDAGRIRADADTYAAAALLVGACAQRAFAYAPLGVAPTPQSDEEFSAALARTVLSGVGI